LDFEPAGAEDGSVAVLEHADFRPLNRKVTVQRGETTVLEVDLPREAFPK